MTRIVSLRSQHASDAARLHIAGQPGTFLTSLGPKVLTALYRALSRSATGFGYAAVDEQDDQTAIAFVSATTSIGHLFKQLSTSHLGSFAPPLLSRLASNPSLALRSAQTILYPLLTSRKVDSARKGTSAELLSIMVEPARRNSGIGTELLHRLVEECFARQIDQIDVTVDAQNDGARRFYERHGFCLDHGFRLYGREMVQYSLALQDQQMNSGGYG
jgi:ribosomal protein S18 acetylase RimI-like enzyme